MDGAAWNSRRNPGNNLGNKLIFGGAKYGFFV